MWGLMRNSAPAPSPNTPTAEAVNSAPAETSITPPPALPGQTAAERALALGNWYYDQHRWQEAITQYETALAGIDNPDIRTDLGNCYRFAGSTDKALEQYNKAQAESPSHEQSLFNTMTLYGDVLGDKAKAASVATQYLSRFPAGEHLEMARKFLANMNTSSAQPTPTESQPEPAAKAELGEWMKKQQ